MVRLYWVCNFGGKIFVVFDFEYVFKLFFDWIKKNLRFFECFSEDLLEIVFVFEL